MLFCDHLIGNEYDSIFNSHGHRSKELSELNLRNHFIVLGDTAGLQAHIKLEDTFPYLLSKRIKTDYYNLSVKDGGLDVLKYNLYTWISKVGKPKFIIISCEHVNALLTTDLNKTTLIPTDDNNSPQEQITLTANYSGFFNARNTLFDLLVKNTIIFPIYQLTWKNKVKVLSENSNTIFCDELTQEEIADCLYQKISIKRKAAINI